MHDSPTLHVLDIENLVGGPVPNPEAVKAVHGEYMRMMAPTGPNRSVMGTSHIAAKHIWFSWPDRSTKRLVRSGADGADLALLNYLSEPANLRGHPPRCDCLRRRDLHPGRQTSQDEWDPRHCSEQATVARWLTASRS